MNSQAELQEVLVSAGESTVIYTDGSTALPQVEEEARRDALISRVEEVGAPAADVVALEQALPHGDGTPSPSARYLLARDGRVEIDATFPEPRLGSERVYFGTVPLLVPFLRHSIRSVRYLVVETGREGAEVRLERADRHASEQTETIEGRTDSLTKVQAGGYSHARYQRSAEEVWKHNQTDVASVIDKLVEQQRPEFIVLSGDVRARQMLKSRLSEAATALVVEHDVHTRAEGSDDEGLAMTISELAEQHRNSELKSTIDRAKADDGSSGAQGISEVVDALQQARVDTLVLDARLLESDRTLRALEAEPWIAESDSDSLDARSLGDFPLADVLARAAIITGARVLIREEEFASEDEPRSDSEPDDPIAALRWANDPNNA
ncbi:MAG: baeRF2 domain-containing protein [Leucobacter sp.]